MTKHFNKENVSKLTGFKRYRKKVITLAKRIDGPFMVETQEGDLYCSDGYLALDDAGFPYPIVVDQMEKMYEDIDK